VIYITRQVCETTEMTHMATLVYIQRSHLALGPRFRQLHGPHRRLLWNPGVAIWAFFEILSDLVIYSSCPFRTTT